MEDVELFGGNCPKLKHFRLEGAKCRWSQAVFQRLESFELSKIFFDNIGPFLDIIRNMPQLKRLEICDCNVFSEEVPANTQPVSLPSLQSLRVEFNNEYGGDLRYRIVPRLYFRPTAMFAPHISREH